MKHFFLLAFLIGSVARAAEYTPPSTRFGTYSANVVQGVVGGIPTRAGGNVINVTDYGWSAMATASENTTAFQDALAASAEGDIISLPAGTYAVTTLEVTATTRNRTIRGAGMDATILEPTSAIGFNGYSAATDYGNVFNPETTIATLTKDSATIVLTDGSGFPTPANESQYRIGRIKLVNGTDPPVLSVYGYDFVRSFTVLMTARSGNNVTLSQPLPSAFADGATGAEFELGFQVPSFQCGIGLEALTIDGTDSGAMQVGASYTATSGCWMLNVKVMGHTNYGIRVYDSVNVEIRRCYVAPSGEGSNHGGLLYNRSSYGLVEDNIFTENGPNIEVNESSTANVFAYNFCGLDGSEGFIINTNHGPHNSYNLFEGNVSPYQQADGYFGGCSEETYFRNWNTLVVPIFKRFSRYQNMVGNIIGTPGTMPSGTGEENWGDPNIGNSSSTGTAEPSADDWWLDWNVMEGAPKEWPGTLTTRTSDTAGVITLETGLGTDFETSLAESLGVRLMRFVDNASVGALSITDVTGDVVTFDTYSGTLPAADTDTVIYPGYVGFQEKDLDVENTLIRKANYYVFTGDIPAGESLGGDTIPASYFRGSKPAWFGNRNWPPYDSANVPGTLDGSEIPAGYRFLNDGEDPPAEGGGGSTTISGSGSTTVSGSGSTTIQ